MSITTQFITMLTMIGMGGWLGLALDTYSRFLQRSKRANWVVFINDILFWIVQALVVFYVLLVVNQGELRFYIFLALLCGYAAYQSLFRNIYLKVLDFMIRTGIAIYRIITKTLYYVTVRPVQLLIQLLLIILTGSGHILLVVLRGIYKLSKSLLMLLFSPFKWLMLILWKLVPFKWRLYMEKFFSKLAGVFAKGKNMKNIMHQWWKKFRR